jgi:pimeloyl-ACP methyl ester carboxylesterase
LRTTTEELVFTHTEDGLGLTGLLIRPTTAASVVAVVWIHGNTGAFYDWPYVTIGRALAKHGYAFVTGNTRGHNISATLWRLPEDIPTAGGSAWERLEDAPYDIAAWVDFMVAQGFQRIVLVGHSQGAAKVIAYQAQRGNGCVAGVAAASPDLHGHWPSDLVAAAERLVTEDRGAELLLPLPDAPWYQLSAQNVVSRARILSQIYQADHGSPAIAQLQCPVLAFFGTADLGGAAELASIRQSAHYAAHVETVLLEGADHVYTGREHEAASLIANWITTLR